MLIYKKGDLFSSPDTIIKAHACNSQGIWGSGIAAEFKKRYPQDYVEYSKFCSDLDYAACGRSTITSGLVGCMITSEFYGQRVDSPNSILSSTELAVNELITEAKNKGNTEIHSNMFNSGLFNVPWYRTEEILIKVLRSHRDIEWVVWVK